MVKIEILDVGDCSQRQQESNKERRRHSSKLCSNVSVIATLARCCAAEVIQARWRGIRCRRTMKRQNADAKTLNALIDSHICFIYACEKIQKFWRVRYASRLGHSLVRGTRMEGNPLIESSGRLTIDSSVQTGTIVFDVPSIRQKVISHIERLCQQYIQAMDLNGNELVYILKEIGLVGVREYEGMMKAHSIQKGSRNFCKITGKKYAIRLASLHEFHKDFCDAWHDFMDIMYKYYRSVKLTPSWRKNFTFNSAQSTRARELVIEMSSLPKDFVHFLNENHQVQHYSISQIKSALSILGCDDKCIVSKSQADDEWTIIDHIQNFIHQAQTPWDRSRFVVAYHLVRRVSKWENYLDEIEINESLDDLYLKLNLAKVESSELMDEVESLRMELKHYRNYRWPSDDAAEVKANERIYHVTTDRLFCSADVSETKSSLMQEQDRKKNVHEEFAAEPKKKICAKLNRIDIKFEADSNERSANNRKTIPKLISTGDGKVANKFTALPKKKTSGIQSSCQTVLDNSMKQSIDKRLHVCQKSAWTYGKESERDYLKMEQQNDCILSSEETYETESPDSIYNTKRFNDILEKLRLYE